MQKSCSVWIRLSILTVLSYSTLFSQATISGIITNSKSGEVAINAQLLLYPDTAASYKSPFRSALTNKFGFYSMTQIPNGKYILYVRLIGYKLFKDSVAIISFADVKKNILIEEDPVQLEEVTIVESRELANAPTVSRINVSTEILQTMPSFGSEKDVFRVLQLLPGVKSSSEVSSGLYIRGGSADQNLVLLDGVIVYNPFHLGGFLSTFNPDALLNVQLMKGAFPAEYGGRLSSVIEMTMKEGTKEKFMGSGGLSLISSKLTLQGPITDNMTYMVSGRRMYLDILQWLAGVSSKTPKYYFYDLNAKLNYTFSSDDRLFLSGYYGGDVLTSPPEIGDPVLNIFCGNATTNLRWMHIVDPTLFTNFSLIYTNFRFSTLIESTEGTGDNLNFKSISQVQDFVAKGDVQYYANEDHLIKAGVDATHHSFIANANTNVNIDFNLSQTKLSALEGALYVQDEWKISSLLNANIGSRLYYFQNGNYLNLEPRISFAYSLDDATTAKAAYSVGHQYLHLITRNETLLPTDVWFPSTSVINPSKSWQIVTGLETSLLGNEYFSSIEFYYKGMQHLYEYKDDAEFSFGVPLENQFTSGIGYSYGMEIFLNKRIGSFTGWIGYTLSWTKRKFEELNLGREFFPRYDRRHDVSVVLNYKLGEKWELGASWVYGTGQAFTIPEGFYLFAPIEGTSYAPSWSSNQYISQRNNYRAPAYHRLDLNFIYHRTVFWLDSELSLNIYNVYSRKNPFYIFMGTDYSNNGSSKTVLKQFSLFPIIPTLGWSFVF